MAATQAHRSAVRPLGPGIERVHMIGIGGAGMEALARILHEWGYQVSGSDVEAGPVLAALRRDGIAAFAGHRVDVAAGADMVVHSSAVPTDDLERQAARRAGVPELRRGALLGMLSRACDTIAVAGTHGKTTTASLVAVAAAAAGRQPAVAIGGWCGGATQATAGAGRLLVAEADEYDRSFLELIPWLPVVTNIELDHVDCYADESEVVDSFAAFLDRRRADAAVIVNGDDPACLEACRRAGVEPLRFGFGPACQVRAEDLRLHAAGVSFELVAPGLRRRLDLRLPGRHNAANVLAASAAVLSAGFEPDPALEAMQAFAGVDRRFQVVGRWRGATVVDDYAHHPTELAAALATAREAAAGRVLAVFQPHTYSRTRHFRRAFAEALAMADVSWVTGVYAAREVPAHGEEADGIVADLETAGVAAAWIADPERALDDALAAAQPDDLVLVLGAGDLSARVRRRLPEAGG